MKTKTKNNTASQAPDQMLSRTERLELIYKIKSAIFEKFLLDNPEIAELPLDISLAMIESKGFELKLKDVSND